ncbi:MAG: protein kinase, partial [bacterium]|nr:protein kinase [Candidatus Colisoma equi]
PYIAEELLEPGNLPTGDRQRAKYLLALCEGLKALHAKGVVHRDLKPANILFRKSGEPVIVDLGLAKSVEVPVLPDGVSIIDGKAVGVGTPEYAAPEQFTGGDITPASDVHALGVLAEKLLGDQARLRKWRSGILSASPWRRIIRRATSSIASERYQSVDAFAAAIRRRHWLRNGILAGLFLAATGLLFGLIVALSEPTLPDVLELRGQTVVINEPLVLKSGRTYRIIGPGTLDADLSGPESTVLWMTNCVVLNRSKFLPPKNNLRYELTHNVYLNLIGAGEWEREPSGSDYFKFYNIYDGAFNEVRFRGPDTLSGLMQLRNKEFFDSVNR